MSHTEPCLEVLHGPGGAVCHVTGARPNFPKAAPVMQALAARGIGQVLVHTGQHYDDNMSKVFFDQLDLPYPDVNLGIGSGTHAIQTGAVMQALEEMWTSKRPVLVVVYGDVNSTLAAALVASKMGIALAHVEAGLRSFDMSMPEEVNRLVTDRLSDLLFATSVDAVAHLGAEGVPSGRIEFVGNPMIDTLLRNRKKFDIARLQDRFEPPEKFVVATLHRPGNVDDDGVLDEVFGSLQRVSESVPVIMPLHPRTRARLERRAISFDGTLHAIDPLGYLEFMSLVNSAECVITDSGGIQEETTVLGVPCLTLRPNTERPVTISHGTNQLVTVESLPDVVDRIVRQGRPDSWPTPPLWDGLAGERIADSIARFLAGPKESGILATRR